MMKPIMKTLSNRAVGKLEVEKDTVFRDGELTGFGVRVYPTGARVYIAQARGPEGPKRVAVGAQARGDPCGAGEAARGPDYRAYQSGRGQRYPCTGKNTTPPLWKKGAQGEERGEEGRRAGPPLQSEGWAPEGRASHMTSSTDSV